MKKRFVLAFILLFSIPLWAQDGQGGTESNLSYGFGARAIGLGQAFTALADDPSAMTWNPAGLEYVYQQSVSLFHSTLFEGTLYDFMGYAYPTLHLGTFGLAVGRIGIGDIHHTGPGNEDLGTFSFEEYHGYFSYAKRLPWDLTAGLTVHAVRRGWSNLNGEVDLGVGMDFGMLYLPDFSDSPILQDWALGLTIHNLFAPQVNEGVEIDKFPLGVRMGFSKKMNFLNGTNQLIALFDADYSQYRDMRYHFGAEYRFRDFAMLRVGYDGRYPAFGAGVKYSVFQIDYAFGQLADTDFFPSVHRISLTFNFGTTRDEMLTQAEAERQAEEEKLIADMREKDRQQFIHMHIANADSFFKEGKYLDAIVEYQQVIGQDAFNKRATVMLDSAENQLNRQIEEEQNVAIQTALDKDRAEANRKFVKVHFDKGRLYLDKKQYMEALIEFNLAKERAPNETSITSAIQTTKRRMSEETTRLIQQGRQEFKNGNYAKALGLLADARLLGGDNQAIQTEIETLSKRIKLQENIQKGMSLFEIGQYDEATKVFEQALQISPENSLAKQYYQKSKIETVGKSQPMDTATERQYLQGVDKFVKGKYKEAIAIWEEILKIHPYNKKILKAIESARERLKKNK